jgi:2-keto-3-deoxy-L-rhamnonate aldolase RhmA
VTDHPLPRRLAAGEVLSGVFVRTPSHHVVEVLAAQASKPDVIALDAEHAPFDLATLDVMLAVAAGVGLPALVRVPDRAGPWIQQSLDLGAAGVVVPHVASADEAREAVAAAHHPGSPHCTGGRRGYSPSTRSSGWGSRPMADILDRAARETTVIVQIEDPEGVAAAPAIASVPGVDGVLVGRSDLAVALAADGPGAAEVRTATRAVADACRAAGVALVAFTSGPDDRAEMAALGATVFFDGTDQSRLAP